MQMPCVGISVHRLAGSSVHREGGGGGLTSAAPMGVAVKDQICRGGGRPSSVESFGSETGGLDSGCSG